MATKKKQALKTKLLDKGSITKIVVVAIFLIAGFFYVKNGVSSSSAFTLPPITVPQVVFVGDETENAVDTNPGTKALPVRTIRHAIDLVNSASAKGGVIYLIGYGAQNPFNVDLGDRNGAIDIDKGKNIQIVGQGEIVQRPNDGGQGGGFPEMLIFSVSSGQLGISKMSIVGINVVLNAWAQGVVSLNDALINIQTIKWNGEANRISTLKLQASDSATITLNRMSIYPIIQMQPGPTIAGVDIDTTSGGYVNILKSEFRFPSYQTLLDLGPRQGGPWTLGIRSRSSRNWGVSDSGFYSFGGPSTSFDGAVAIDVENNNPNGEYGFQGFVSYNDFSQFAGRELVMDIFGTLKANNQAQGMLVAGNKGNN